MSEKKGQQEKGGKCKIKCGNCHFYDKEDDYCIVRDIANCTKQFNVNFSKCDDYLIKESLVMF